MEKLQSNFVDPIESDTKSIVIAHVLQSAENIKFVESIKKYYILHIYSFHYFVASFLSFYFVSIYLSSSGY